MRYTAKHKEETRARVIAEAARIVRSEGADGLGVAQVMASAGLTHGGFYAHFRSRDDLLAEAVARAFADTEGMLDRAEAKHDPREALAAYVTTYLSTRHRAAVSTGCPVPLLAADAMRMPDAARAEFAKGLGTIILRLGRMLAAAGGSADGAPSLVAELVGALTLSRLIESKAEAETFLDGVRRSLLRRFHLESEHG